MELLWSFQLIEADPEWVEKVGWAGLGCAGWAGLECGLTATFSCVLSGRRVGQWQHINTSTHSPPSLSPTPRHGLVQYTQKYCCNARVLLISISVGVIGDCVGDMNPIPFC